MKTKNKADDFEEAYTNLQCLIIAQVNKFSTEGLSATQYLILDYIIRNGECTTSQLAAVFRISLPAISRQVKKLIGEGFIIQRRAEVDRRNYFHAVTPKAVALVSKAERLRKTMSSEIQGILSTEERKDFIHLCGKIVSGIKLK